MLGKKFPLRSGSEYEPFRQEGGDPLRNVCPTGAIVQLRRKTGQLVTARQLQNIRGGRHPGCSVLGKKGKVARWGGRKRVFHRAVVITMRTDKPVPSQKVGEKRKTDSKNHYLPVSGGTIFEK